MLHRRTCVRRCRHVKVCALSFRVRVWCVGGFCSKTKAECREPAPSVWGFCVREIDLFSFYFATVGYFVSLTIIAHASDAVALACMLGPKPLTLPHPKP